MREFDGQSHYPINLDQLPSNWTTGWIREICASIQSGFASGEHNSDGQGIPHLRPMNIDRKGYLDLAEVKYVSPDQDSRRLARGDVLFNNTNSPVLIGKTCPILTDADFAFSNHMTRLRPRAGVDARFLAHELHYLWMSGFFLHKCVKHVNQASVSADVLGSTIPFAVAPSGEQRRIVEAIERYFTRLDDAVATLERVQRNLKRYRASVLKAAVEGRLVPTEAELARTEGRAYEPASLLLERILTERRRRWHEAGGQGKYTEPAVPDIRHLPELPEGWHWTTVDVVGDVLLGRQRAPQYLTGQWSRPYLRVANIKDDAIDFADVDEMDFHEAHFKKYRLDPGDILVSEGQSPELLGQSAIYRGSIDGVCFQKTLHRFRPVPGGPSTEFAQIVFRAHVKTGVFKRLGSITTNIAHLTLVKFKVAPFPLPPAAEQARIVAETERLLTIADAIDKSHQRQLARLDRLRQAILKWAFEGKLADQDPSDEPASTLLERIRTEAALRMSSAATGAPQKGRGRRGTMPGTKHTKPR